MLAAAAAAAAMLPGELWLASLGLAILAIAVGLSRFRDRAAGGWSRLGGAAGAFGSSAVLVAGLTKVALTLAAIRAIASQL